jgi:hypothetical protein
VWLQAEPTHGQHACEVAASFELNDDWEFDADGFLRLFNRPLARDSARGVMEPDRRSGLL